MSRRNDIDPGDAEQLFDQRWPARRPPEGFAERVVDAVMTTAPAAAVRPRRHRRSWPLRLAAGSAAAAGLALAVWGVLGGGRETSDLGHLRAQQRRTVQVGARVVAVVEAGGEIAWSGRGGRLRVDQPTGSVFYRVDRGGSFQVITPAGEVEVTGTCFRVTAEGAEQVTSTWVEVMEGAVILRNGQGEVGLTPGERGRIALGAMPVKMPWPHDPLEGSQLALEGRSPSETGRRPTPVTVPLRAPGAAVRPTDPLAEDEGRGKFFDFSPTERQALARRCNFRWSLPRHLTHFSAMDFKDVPLQSEQRAAIARLMEQHRQEFLADLRNIYLEVVGDRQTVDRLTALSLYQEIDAKSLREDGIEARRMILNEWAGTAAAPADLKLRPPIERMWRMLVGSTDEIVRRLETVVSRDDARRIGKALLDVRVSGTEPRCPSGNSKP
jgi:hypothetical protein